MRHHTKLFELLRNALPELEHEQIQRIIADVHEQTQHRPVFPLKTLLHTCAQLLSQYGWIEDKDYLRDNSTVLQFRKRIVSSLSKEFPMAALEDLEEAFHRAYEKTLRTQSQQVQQMSRNKLWCYYYLRRAAINCYRSIRREQEATVSLPTVTASLDFSPERILLENEHRQFLHYLQQRIGSRFSPLHWVILLWHYRDGETQTAIAQKIGKSPSQVCRMLKQVVTFIRNSCPPPRTDNKSLCCSETTAVMHGSLHRMQKIRGLAV